MKFNVTDYIKKPSKKAKQSSQAERDGAVPIRLSKGKGFSFRSISTKLFLYFFISIVLFVAIVGTMSYIVSRDTLKSKVAEASEQTVEQTTEKLDFLYNFYENIATQIAVDRTLMGDLETRQNFIEGDFQATDRYEVDLKIRNALAEIASTNDIGLQLFDKEPFMKPDAMELTDAAFYSTANGSSLYADYTKYFDTLEKSAGRVIWLGTVEKQVTTDSKTNYITLGKMLKAGTGTFFVFIEFKDEVLMNALETVKLGNEHHLTISGEDGNVIYSFDPKEIRKPLNLTLPVSKDKEDVSGSFNNGDDLVLYSASEVNKWRVTGSVPVSELTKDINRIFVITIILIAAAIVISLLIGYLIVRTVGKPINQVRDLMEKVEQGDLTVRMNVNRKDEIGKLGQSFNQMASNVGKLIHRTNETLDYVVNTSVQLQDVSRKMGDSAKEVSLATEEIARGASDLSQQSEDGSTQAFSMQEEMRSFVRNNQEMQEQAEGVKGESRSGIEQMDILLGKTNESEKLTRETLNRAQKLMDSTKQIGQILQLMDEVAKRTNLLSLNAAIEAARAGEHGKGFAVVANEVRKLAEQSSGSIGVVTEIIGTIVDEVELTVKALKENYPIHQEQVNVAKNVDHIFRQVDSRMNGFVQKIAQTSTSISNLQASQSTLSEMILQVSATAEESTAISEEVASSATEQLGVSAELVQTSEKLSQLSNELRNILSEFVTGETEQADQE
ncbi:methyl-accepting chemotaxis sensory transducer with Cache sensor [Paenibacillus cellulosilyticus]|uniref:Methyl-accepting chemotaxis sensory transducer with Cache sensor n=1 Tax=Paenibacillus cellulosilyticus TaxID=375489 RepID=A0A2V2YRH7_9BACL|nr:methyl-accepting chemotaxis protein [Paenibacillus cellulosilyticus]PWV98645.1 methyl-accepting chemotaxis sensory transducer with Cache sensor [Paenibacillus cellulosilyticus]QKS43842.1 methyl-accepting chemotaxis protein [Paenibacillus cellulosilyticus]